jgi:hypothetical protein
MKAFISPAQSPTNFVGSWAGSETCSGTEHPGWTLAPDCTTPLRENAAVHHSEIDCRMAATGLGCAKTPAVAPHVEISPGNCIPESQIILHTRGSMPCWRIVFSTFCGCMSFYTGSVIRDRRSRSRTILNVRFAPKADKWRVVSVCRLVPIVLQKYFEHFVTQH